MKRSIYLFFILGMFFMLQSCSQEGRNDNPDNLVAPTIPPVSLFTIPTQSFGLVNDKASPSTRNDKSNWIHAGLNVLVWNSVVFVHTAVPIAAFGHALEYEKEYIGNLTWEWKYEFQASPENDSKIYDVSLTGQYINNEAEVVWTMTVSEKGTSNSFVWYEGIVSRDHSEGTFTINKDPQNPVPYMDITFTKYPITEDITIRFSNVLANDPGNGDYIEWRTNNGGEFDRAYDVFNKGNLLEIEGNESSKNGRVKHPIHFNDEEWHCWDTAHLNIDC